MRKIKFFLLGLIPGTILVLFILNKKGASCSGYLPNSRVIAETLSKEFIYSPEFKTEMGRLEITEQFLKDSIITEGKIDFDRSKAQQQPCPEYVLNYPAKKPRFEIEFEKCKNQSNFKALRKIN